MIEQKHMAGTSRPGTKPAAEDNSLSQHMMLMGRGWEGMLFGPEMFSRWCMDRCRTLN